MTIRKAFRDAFRVFFGHFGASLKFLLMRACTILFCLAPVLFLFAGGYEWLALLCLPLLLLVGLPLRMNAAEAMQASLGDGSLFSLRLINFAGYGAKLICALKRVCFLLLWNLPLLACCYVAKDKYSGKTDSFTLLREIKAFMGANDLKIGALYLLGILTAVLLLAAVGNAFHSGARHAFALGDKQLLHGHHGKLMLCWLCALVTLLPLLLALGIAIAGYLPVLQDLTGLIMGSVKLPDTKRTLIIVGVGAVLTLPLLPLRSLITAAFVGGLKNGEEK